MQIMPAIKLGFAQMDLNDVKTINNYIDTNIQRLPDHSSSLVGQIKQHKKSAQPEFILDDPVFGAKMFHALYRKNFRYH